MYKKILVPLDGSELAEVALPYAEGVAGRLKAELVMLMVCPETDPVYAAFGDDAKLRQAGAGRYLHRLANDFKEQNIEVRLEVRLGPSASTIVDMAEEEGFGLIIMATHGRSGLGRWVLGSTADKVLRAATRPVLLIRAKGEQPEVRAQGIFNRILVPLDGSPEGESILPHVEALAMEFKSELILFRVVPFETYIMPVGTEGAYDLTGSAQALMQAQLEDSRDYLEGVKERLSEKGFHVIIDAFIGQAAEEIINKAESHDAGLVAMCTHGRSGVERWVHGSVATKVLHGGSTPLLLVRAPEVQSE